MTTRENSAGNLPFIRHGWCGIRRRVQVSSKLGVDNFDNRVNFTNNMVPEHQKPTNATDIGIKLVGHAKSTEFSAHRGLVIELFPFIFEASQRMSARAISRFLLDEQGVRLSAVTITKALNDPQKSWNAFFDTIEPSARIIANWKKSEAFAFLFKSRVAYESIVDQAIGSVIGRFAAKLILKEDVVSADKVLRAKWFCINTETRQKARAYLESRLVV